MTRIFFFCLAMIASAAASAQVQSFESIMNGIVRGTPGVTSVVVGNGIRTVGTGLVPVATPGLTIPVSTTVAVDVGYGTVATGLGRVAMRAIPWVGAAVAAGYAADALKTAAYPLMTCEPPMYWCKPGKVYQDISYKAGTIEFRQMHSDGGDSGIQTTAAGSCSAFTSSRTAVHAGSDGYSYKCIGSTEWVPGKTAPGDSYQWTNKQGQVVGSYNAGPEDMGARIRCPDGSYLAYTLNGECKVVTSSGGEPVPATIEDVNKALSDKANADHNWALAAKQEMDKVAQANPELETPINWKGLPVTVTAPETSGPQTKISTEQITNPDGTTSTKTTTQQTTVTPVVPSNATVDAPGVSYPSKTTTSTTITNNNTNVSTTTTNVTNNAAPVAKPDIPTDYNREATQKKILEQLDVSGITPPDDPNPRVKSELEKTDKGLADLFQSVPNGLMADKASWFSWVWTPPIGTCSGADFTGVIRGYSVSFDICTWVGRIRELFGWLFALFGAINIYGNLFKKADA